MVLVAFTLIILHRFGVNLSPHFHWHEIKHKLDPQVRVFDTVPGEGHFRYPHGVCLSPDGSLLFIAEWFHDHIQVYRTADMSWVRAIGKQGTGEGEFHNPSGCVVSPDSKTLYVADEDNNRIQVYRVEDGSHVRIIGRQGGGPGEFQDPRGLTITPDGKLLVVADFGNHRVQLMSTADGSHVRTIGCGGDLLPSHGKGEFYSPAGVAVSPNGEWLYVADFADHAIEVFRMSDAEHVRRYGNGIAEKGSGNDDFDHPHDVFVSHDGVYLYVADMMNDRIKVIRAIDGKFVKSYGSTGHKRLQFKHPLSVALPPSSDWLYVSDFGNDRVQMIKMTH